VQDFDVLVPSVRSHCSQRARRSLTYCMVYYITIYYIRFHKNDPDEWLRIRLFFIARQCVLLLYLILGVMHVCQPTVYSYDLSTWRHWPAAPPPLHLIYLL
jgi:hypothetical protein